MKSNAIFRIIAYSIAIVILSGLLLTGLGFSVFSVTTHTELSAYNETHAIESAQIRNIKIEWAAGDILIEPNDTADTITVGETASEEKYQMVCSVNGSTLSIQFSKPNFGTINLGVDGEAKDLHITVPANWICKDLDIEAAAANVMIRDLTIGELDFDGASGYCTLDNCHVTHVDVDAASGDLTFIGTLETLEFDGASADCKLTLSNCPQWIKLDGMSGDLEITLPSDCGFTADFDGLNCDFSTEFKTTTHNGAHIYGDGSCKIQVNALSGSVIIHDSGHNCQS
jgi:DUF4097 and DUF4098 domain-containing protein YvlB